MTLATWAAYGADWAANEKVSFNGVARTVTVNSGVTALDIGPDVYSAWKRWVTRDTNARFLSAMRSTGNDPIPGGATGSTFFLVNNWKLVYDPRNVAVSGVLYSENYATAYWDYDGDAVYPATVAALVNNAVSVQNVVSGTALTEEQTAAAVWGYVSRSLTSMPDAIVTQIISALMSQAQTTPIYADTRKMNGAAVLGNGTSGNQWRGE